ncbi:uncharacterized protein PG998_010569 [Apiospora kogelbergensis]|uniref:uncharacterized protein n=1 Tax=Apiospora kogelbergensis TaxID=1337665 RepID=UPI00312D8F68
MPEAVETLTSVALSYYLTWINNTSTNAPLRFRFNKEYKNMDQNMHDLTHDMNAGMLLGSSVGNRWGPGSIRQDAASAWSHSLVILRQACRGRLPRTASDVLLFTALSKAMSAEIDATQDSKLENELLDDLNRWNLLLQENPVELSALEKATSAIWGVDITKRTIISKSGISADVQDFENIFGHFEDLANNLIQTSYSALIHSENRPQQPITGQNSHQQTFIGREESHRQVDTPLPLKPPDKRYGVSESTIYMVMAGVAFAAVFAFLITLNFTPEVYMRDWRSLNDTLRSIVTGGNPVASGAAMFQTPTTSQMLFYSPADVQRCDAAHVIERSYLLLALLLGYLVPMSMSPSNATTEPLPVEGTDLDTISVEAASAPLSRSGGHVADRTTPSTTESVTSPTETVPVDTPPAQEPVFKCRHCPYTCPQRGRLNRHTKEKHSKVRYRCSAPGCRKDFARNCYREEHERKRHGGLASLPPKLPAAYLQLPIVERVESFTSSSPTGSLHQ